jgi:catechol 2,3-dioxygenase-like lactoylglutathione lyase family enzyme
LGYEPSAAASPQGENLAVRDEIQRNRLVFLRHGLSGETIELIEPMDSQSSVASAKKGLAHLCYEVDDLEAVLADIKQKRLGVVFTPPLIAPGLGHGRIAFVYFKGGAVIEFFEPRLSR